MSCTTTHCAASPTAMWAPSMASADYDKEFAKIMKANGLTDSSDNDEKKMAKWMKTTADNDRADIQPLPYIRNGRQCRPCHSQGTQHCEESNQGIVATIQMMLMQMLMRIFSMFSNSSNDESDPLDGPFGGGYLPYQGRSHRPNSAGNGATWVANDGRPLTEADSRSNARMERLASIAATNARNEKRKGTKNMCSREVVDSLKMAGYDVDRPPSAYLMADILARHKDFREVKPPKDLRTLPAGAIVVWDRGPGNPHGHISVALGNGREASDHIQGQITNYGTRCRVFYPV